MYSYYVKEHTIQTAWVTRRKVWATLGGYSLNALGYTRAAMLDTVRRDSEKRSKSHKI